MHTSRYLALTLLGASLPLTWSTAFANNTIIIGEMQVGYDYWDRQYDDKESIAATTRTESRQWYATPQVALEIKDVRDYFWLSYSPTLKYSETSESSDVDHFANLDTLFYLSQKWSVNFSDLFARSDDPYLTDAGPDRGYHQQPYESDPTGESSLLTEEGTELAPDLGRPAYWQNQAVAHTDYAYASMSRFLLGYGNRILRNDDDEPGYLEYDSHDFFGQWIHRYGHAWGSDLLYHYITGSLDESESVAATSSESSTAATQVVTADSPASDVVEHRGEATANYYHDKHDNYALTYGHLSSLYDNDVRRDIWAHSLTATWNHGFDERSRLVLGAGPTYVEAEDADGVIDYNGRLHFTRTFERSALELFLDKSYRNRNFSGSENSGVVDSYRGGITFTTKLSQKIAWDIYGIYQDSSTLDPQDDYYLAASAEEPTTQTDEITDITYDVSQYRAGTGLHYSFLKHYQAGVDYEYLNNDGDLARDSYEDHRVIVWVAAIRELARW